MEGLEPMPAITKILFIFVLIFFSCDKYSFYKKEGVELFNIYPGTFNSQIGSEPTYRNIDKNECSESNIDALSNITCFERVSVNMGWDYDIYKKELYKASLVINDQDNVSCDPLYGSRNNYYILPYVYLKGLANYYSSLNMWATNHLYIGSASPPPVRFYSDSDIDYCPTTDRDGKSLYDPGNSVICYSLRDTVNVYPKEERVYSSNGPSRYRAFTGNLKINIPSKTDTVQIYCFGDSIWSRPFYIVREGCDQMRTGIAY